MQCDPLSPDSVSVSWKPPPLELSNGVILGYHVTFRLENKIGGENRYIKHIVFESLGCSWYPILYGTQPQQITR